MTIGVIDIRRIMEDAKSKIEMHAKKTILVLDEIHHFNRSQQDVLLPYIEEGIITLVGITTENPLFCINATIISRSIIVFEFKSLQKKALLCILDLALKDKENGFGNFMIMFLHSLSQCTELIRMRQFIGWQRCLKLEKIQIL